MLEVKNLVKKFGKRRVLKGINLKVEKGEVVGIIGSSGCGKSTLLRSINYLEKPTSGKIIFKGVDTSTKKNLTEHRMHIGMVFQQFNLFKNMSVLDNIILAPVKLHLKTVNEATKDAKQLLKKIKLENKIDAYPASLSGGQQQRIAIIRALNMEPELMLFDEPTSALDPEMIGEVEELIKLIASEGMTMMIVSHDLKFLKEISTRMIYMHDGVIAEDKPTKEFFSNPENENLKAFLKK